MNLILLRILVNIRNYLRFVSLIPNIFWIVQTKIFNAWILFLFTTILYYVNIYYSEYTSAFSCFKRYPHSRESLWGDAAVANSVLQRTALKWRMWGTIGHTQGLRSEAWSEPTLSASSSRKELISGNNRVVLSICDALGSSFWLPTPCLRFKRKTRNVLTRGSRVRERLRPSVP